MTDIVCREVRSRMMAGIHSKDTQPELIVRKWLHAHGYRFRLHKKELPGKPDIVLPRYHSVIFVHGCFWHRHEHCRYATTPGTNSEWWMKKFQKNVERDKKVMKELEEMGYHILVIWECEIKDKSYIEKTVKFFEEIR
ncbi:MAG TPA: DNA mismatch endonuclease Vsr [Candidatus Desulfovibrio intestinipullorum]|uniref:Very short patch repair endonuclease n=1 Tax=Candidatus Desulfovibrio intestinipullorum TaxID=2838536 RepID=A0A9D1PVC7_9BACT|nr:DNA mismatch endonuclease Vsr [Candidatus Desulfovibrio intestinipullorum]